MSFTFGRVRWVPPVSIFSSRLDPPVWCASSSKMIWVFLLLNAFCLVIIAMYFAGTRRVMAVKRLVFHCWALPPDTLRFPCAVWCDNSAVEFCIRRNAPFPSRSDCYLKFVQESRIWHLSVFVVDVRPGNFFPISASFTGSNTNLFWLIEKLHLPVTSIKSYWIRSCLTNSHCLSPSISTVSSNAWW